MPDLRFDTPRTIAPATLVVLAGTGLGVLGSLGVRWAMAVSLSPAELGTVALAIAVASFAGGIGSLGMGTACAQKVAAARGAGRPERALALARGGLLLAAIGGSGAALVLATARVPLARWVGDPSSAPFLLLLAPLALGLALGTALLGISRAHGDVRGRALYRDSLGGGLRFLGVGAAALVWGTATALTAAFAVASLLAELGFGAFVRSRGWLGSLRARRERDIRSGMSTYVGFEILTQGSLWFDTLLLGVLGTPAAVGIYSLARGLGRVLLLAADAAGHRHLPAAAAAWAGADRRTLGRVHSQTRAFTLALCAPGLAVCLLAPADLLSGLFGEEYRAGGSALRLLAAAVLVSVVIGYTDRLLIAVGEARSATRLRAVSLGIGIGVGVLTIPRWGAPGAAIAWAAYLVSIRIVELALLRRLGLPAAWDRALGGTAVRVAWITGLAWSAVVLTGATGWARLGLLALGGGLGGLWAMLVMDRRAVGDRGDSSSG